MSSTRLALLALPLFTACHPGGALPVDDSTVDTAEVSPETPSNPDNPAANCVWSGSDSSDSTFVVSLDENADYTRQTYTSGASPDWRWTMAATFEDGHQTSWTTDDEIDGDIDSQGARTWDGDNELTYSFDDDGDGGFDIVMVYAYDADGHQISATRDDGDDGTIDADYAITWDGDTWTIKVEDAGRDGTIDARWTHSVTTDAEGAVTDVETWDDGDDGIIDSSELWAVDALGQTIYHERDADGSGFADYVVAYSWTDGHLAETAADYYDEDGAFTSHTDTFRTWDAWGRTIRQDYDFGTGQEYAWEYEWTCQH